MGQKGRVLNWDESLESRGVGLDFFLFLFFLMEADILPRFLA